MAVRRIIVNADDLGLCASVNTAIFDVFRVGNLSSATLLVNMPGTADAVHRLKDHPGLAVGLHFCLTEGKACAGPSSLTDAGGRFRDRGTLARTVLRGEVKAADLCNEMEAQLACARELGVPLTHVDSHQHVLMLPPLFRAVAPVLRRSGLPVRIVHPPRRTITADLTRPGRAGRQVLNALFAQQIRRSWSGPANGRLVSIHDLASPGPYDAATYHALIARDRSDDILEVMVHPYQRADDVLELYRPVLGRKRPFLDRCVAEYDALKGAPVFGAYRMITFADLARP